MKRIAQKPYLIFWILIPIVILIGFLNKEKTFHLNIHASYYIISQLWISVLISLLFGLIGIGYYLIITTNRKLYTWMTIIHVATTLLGFVIILLLPYINFGVDATTPLHLFDEEVMQTRVKICMFLLLILGQVIYILNISIASFRKKRLAL